MTALCPEKIGRLKAQIEDRLKGVIFIAPDSDQEKVASKVFKKLNEYNMPYAQIYSIDASSLQRLKEIDAYVTQSASLFKLKVESSIDQSYSDDGTPFQVATYKIAIAPLQQSKT